ncbi:MAG: amidohydrolase [Alphaproteobacteria bacterium]|nr:amidohydrolase [Alphaproteobacteria bacterium]
MTLLANARILTMDPQMREIPNGWIRIENGLISEMGEGSAPADSYLDMGGDLVMPGMVNTHCHMAMTLFRGLGEDVDDRLYRYILPLERECVTAPVVAVGSRLAALEMIRGGVTTVADMYYFEVEVGRATAEAGMRGIVGQTLGDFDAPDHDTFDEAFALTDALVEEFDGHRLITASIAPHAPYSTDIPVMERVAAWADDHPDNPVQMHLAESDAEMDWCARHHNARPVDVVARAGLLRPGLIAAHCLHIHEADSEKLAAHGVGVAHNARSNGKAGRGIAPVEMMRAAGVPVGLATDGAMSGNTLDLFSQFAPASMFQKILGHSRSVLPAAQLIRMATIEGASVLGMDKKIGSLEPGKAADLIRVSLDDPRVQPVYDIYSTLVFALMASDVQATMVDGQWLMRERRVETMDQAKVVADAIQVAGAFNQRIGALDRSMQ